jgi:hypothetical protein
MIKTFTIKLNTEVTIDFSSWGLSDAEQLGGKETKKLVIEELFEQSGMDEFEITEQHSTSLFEAMAGVVKAQNDYYMAHKNEYETT